MMGLEHLNIRGLCDKSLPTFIAIEIQYVPMIYTFRSMSIFIFMIFVIVQEPLLNQIYFVSNFQ